MSECGPFYGNHIDGIMNPSYETQIHRVRFPMRIGGHQVNVYAAPHNFIELPKGTRYIEIVTKSSAPRAND